MEATQEELDRFMSYVDKLPNGCWYWTGGRSRGKGNKKWYGTFWFRGKSIRAHRFSADYIGKFEPLPKGKHRDHLCVFSMCVCPEHLEHTTPEVNQERKIERLATACSDGLDRLKALGLWPFDEPDYSLPVGQTTFCYGDPVSHEADKYRYGMTLTRR
jgi:hypothetical protein